MNNKTIFHNIVQSNSKNKIAELKIALKNQIDINAEDNAKMTALCYAIKNNDYAVAKFLIKNGARLDIIDRFNRTLSKIASMYKSNSCLKLL